MTTATAPSQGTRTRGPGWCSEALRGPQPPFRLVLGADAWEVYTQTTQAHIAAMEPWVEKSRQTAFPPDAL